MAPLIYRRTAAHVTSPLAALDTRAYPNAPKSFTAPSFLGTRDTVSNVADSYNSPSTPNAGVIVGIVLASVVGFLLLLWAVYSCGRSIPPLVAIESSVGSRSGTSVVSSRHHGHGSHQTRSKRRETVEIHTIRRSSSRSRPVIVESPPMVETRRHSRTHGRPIIVPASAVSGTATTMTSTSETSTSVSDEIVVVQSTPPRHNSRRSMDPARFAGGNAPIREVRRSHRRSGR